MNRALLVILAVSVCAVRPFAQSNVDSLQKALLTAKEDTNKVLLLRDLTEFTWNSDPSSALAFAFHGLALSDSLKWPKAKIELHLDIAYVYRHSLSDYVKALDFGLRGLALAESAHDLFMQQDAWLDLGSVYEALKDTSRTLGARRNCLNIAKLRDDSQGIGTGHRFLASTYESFGDHMMAKAHYDSALYMMTAMKDSAEMSAAWSALGQYYLRSQEYNTATEMFTSAEQMARKIGHPSWEVSAVEGLCRVHMSQGTAKRARPLLGRLRELCRDEGWNDRESFYSLASDVEEHCSDMPLAVSHALKALAYSDSIGNPRLIMGAHHRLYRLYREVGEQNEAFIHLDRYLIAKDSLEQIMQTKGAALLISRMEYEKVLLTDSLAHQKELDIKAREVEKQKLIRNASFGGLAFVALFAGIFLFQRNRIGKEKKRSDELLLNILPSEVAEELKANGEAKAKEFAEVTILFTDFKGFTGISEKLSASDLVAELNTCFKTFDNIITAKGVEKIKTIGDAYMAAGGLPVPGQCSAADVVYAALEMQDFMIARKAERDAQGLPAFQMRAGIHTGPVVAGIVGVKKFAYDIWGDTVNIASRMESAGEVGRVNISGATHSLVSMVRTMAEGREAHAFHFRPRGKVNVKGKGDLEMFFVEQAPQGSAV